MDESTRWPQLGATHKDGSRFVGIFLGPVDPYDQAGTPVLNKLHQTTVSAGVADLHIGDHVAVRFDGVKNWWAYVGDERIGRLPWSPSDYVQKPWQDRPRPRIDVGELEITRLLLDPDGAVINVGGIVRQASHLDDARPPAPDPDGE